MANFTFKEIKSKNGQVISCLDKQGLTAKKLESLTNDLAKSYTPCEYDIELSQINIENKPNEFTFVFIKAMPNETVLLTIPE